MSRIGKIAIKVPKEVTIEKQDDTITVKGPMGSVTRAFPGIAIEVTQAQISVKDPNDPDKKALWGTARSCIASMVNGVSTLLKKELLKSLRKKGSRICILVKSC
jgi:large subunit ribosomal protein L6